jgi:hypothetical protein
MGGKSLRRQDMSKEKLGTLGETAKGAEGLLWLRRELEKRQGKGKGQGQKK